MFKKILIPLNGSLRAEQALELVKKLLPRNGFEIVLLEATGNPNLVYSVYGYGTRSYVQVRPECLIKDDAYIANVTEKTAKWAPHVEGYTKFDTAERAIVDVAIHEDVDLIIMVTHGYSGVERLLFSSVTEKVIRDAPCPVLALRDGHMPKHMLIALDGSPFSETILAPAFELAKLLKISVTLARVDVPEEAVDLAEVAEIRSLPPGLAEVVLFNRYNRSEYYLSELLERYSAETEEIEVSLDYDIDYGWPGNRLPKLAKKNGCDLIAMATHGRKGLDHFWNRSVTEKVMHHTDTAMLIYHPEPTEIPTK